MRNNLVKFVLLFFIVVLSLWFLLWLERLSFSEFSTFSLFPHASKEIVDCSSRIWMCNKVKIYTKPANCNYWPTENPFYKLKCNQSSDIGKVSLLADPGNYISGPMLNKNYTTKMILSRPSLLRVFVPNILFDFSLLFKVRNLWDIAFLPDGTILATKKSGEIISIRDGKIKTHGNIPVFLDVHSGLLGLAIDPDFSKNKYIYVYYTTSKVPGESFQLVHRVSRFEFINDTIKNEKIILDEIKTGRFQIGGRLGIGPDKRLYVTVGQLKETNVTSGKILRLELDGTVPDDNPYNNTIYSFGHRNPQGIAWNTRTNELLSSEHGHFKYDEINKIHPGQNYGWPIKQCDEYRSKENITSIDPEYCFKNWTFAPSGMVFVNDVDSPWNENLFVAGLRGRHVHRFSYRNSTLIDEGIFFVAKSDYNGFFHPRIRDVAFFNGSLYILSTEAGIAKLTPS